MKFYDAIPLMLADRDYVFCPYDSPDKIHSVGVDTIGGISFEWANGDTINVADQETLDLDGIMEKKLPVYHLGFLKRNSYNTNVRRCSCSSVKKMLL